MRHLTVALIACLLLIGSPALAEDCGALRVISSVDLQPSQSHQQEFVPVKINGADKRLLLDTGGYTSQLTPETVDALKLPTGGSLGTMKYVGGSTLAITTATIADFQIANMRAKNMSMLIDPVPGLEKLADGILASDLFLAYDLDMDFGHDKLNFISTDHCPGKVVYWQAQALAEVPLRIVNGHYLIDITLDGRHMVALVDTGASSSALGMVSARRNFGLTASSADMVETKTNDNTVTMYMHKFGVLSFEGVEIHDPSLAVIDSGLLERERAAPGAHVVGQITVPWDMILGMDMMRHLHIYIATKERKIYITPA